MNLVTNGLEVAIIGISGRFPGSKSVDEFWQNLINGVELVSDFSEPAAKNRKNTSNKTIKAGSILEDIELFDAAFFGFNPREAEIMDPQHRLFLECAWEALENAGYDSERVEKAIGVYAGIGMGYYLYHNLFPNQDLMKSIGGLQTLIAVDKDYVPSRVSYKLNLKGPSVSVGTACSSSLVAVHLACQSLLSGECHMALAAGVAVKVPQNELTLSPDGIISPDGHCRAFDAGANGTLGGNGIGVVVLKRLEDAIKDQDYIYAVIKGSAINNDGGAKIGYTAPSEEGQARVIHAAQVMAEVNPETISYMEAHGTGTPLGDPIEIAAMTRAFRISTDKKGYCAIGSVKTNVGHLDAAAGITGLIKTSLAFQHQMLPPSINFEKANPQIDFENSPFYVNNQLSEWQSNGVPRRAGVSSFGIGGTNAHIILEETPVIPASSPSRSRQLLVISAKTASALQTATANLAHHLKQHPLNLANVAYTLQVGRREFNHRQMVVVEDLEDAVKALESGNSQRVFIQSQETDTSLIVFMFTGQGAQYVNMAQELYQNEAIFRQECDRCCELLKPHLGIDLRSCLYSTTVEKVTDQLRQTAITQPALFVIEYALAKLWMSWGVLPAAMIGHSIGEYVAAHFAGVFSLEDALLLVATRGRLMQQLPPGAMLSVNLSAQEVQSYLGDGLSLAASNGAALSVVSGTVAAVEQLEHQLNQQEIEYRRLHTSHAFHSQMMDAIAEPFTIAVKKVNLNSPQIPFISNVTGTWITPTQATDPNYWAQHLRQRVRFFEGINELLLDSKRIFLEIGPGRTLTTLVKQQAAKRIVLSSIRHPTEQQSDVAFILNTLGKLWLAGVQVNWSGFYTHEQRSRLPLPTYPFERQRYWIDPSSSLAVNNGDSKKTPLNRQVTPDKKRDIANWLYLPKWEPANISDDQSNSHLVLSRTLVFIDQCGLGRQLIEELQQQSKEAIAIQIGSEFAQLNEFTYSLNPENSKDYEVLFKELRSQNKLPTTIVHLWSVTSQGYAQSGLLGVNQAQYVGFYSLLFLAQAIGKQNITQKLYIAAVSNNMQPVTKAEILHPEKATVLGAIRVIPVEFENITCRSIDVSIPTSGSWQDPQLVNQLLTELTNPNGEQISAYRGNQRWVQTFEPVRLDESSKKTPRLQKQGVYLITGGLGGIGLVLAEHLVRTVKAKLLLTGRSAFPARVDWEKWLTTSNESDPISCKIRKLQELEALGAEVIAVTADVTSLEQMQKAIAHATKQFGQLNGIIHAAGVPGGGVIQRKTFEEAQSILAPKVQGTLVLDSLLKNTNLDFFVLCSSLASALGGFGQVDYVGANAFLDAFAHYKTSTDGTFTVAINWDTWQEVGMAAEAAKPSNTIPAIPKPQLQSVNHPLFNHCLIEPAQPEIYISKFSVSKHWILQEHRLMGKAMIPGTAYLEMALAAWRNYTHQPDTNITEIKKVYFPTPLIVEDDAEKEVRTILKKKGDCFEFKIISQSTSDSSQWLEHAIGEIARSNSNSSPNIDIQEIALKCNEREIIINPKEDKPLKGFAEFGPRWDNLKYIKLGKNQGLAFLELPKLFIDDINSYQFHPALMDLALHFLLGQIKDEKYYLPFAYQQLKIQGSLPHKIYSYAQLTEKNLQKGTYKFDITIADEHGTKLVEIKEYTLRKLNENK